MTLLVKLGVAASLASAVARSRYFKALLFHEDRSLRERFHLVLFLALPLALGVVIRMDVKTFAAGDLTFESVILMGVIGGRTAGVLGALLVALPAMLYGEWATLPLYVVAGYIAGLMRLAAPNQDEIWSFSPFFDLSIYRWIRKFLRNPHLDWQVTFFFVIVALEFLRIQTGRLFPGRLFMMDTPQWPLLIAIYVFTVAAVAVPIKIWNSTRIELKLEEQDRLILQARMEALQSQINPHFLFNTLNSISSLVRVEPETARELIVKLANILRRLLKTSEAFVQLRDEMEFIDDYLDIEVARFGRDKLRVTKELDPATLDHMVPSMLLQPLVENSIKHGLAPKVEGGNIHLRSRLEDETLVLEIEDDGVGLAPVERPTAGGIGMSNVAERLAVLYGGSARMNMMARNGAGTIVRLEIPVVDLEPTLPASLLTAGAPAPSDKTSRREG